MHVAAHFDSARVGGIGEIGGHFHDEQATALSDDQRQEGETGEASELAETVPTQSPTRSPAEAGPVQRRDQDRRLHGDAQGRAARQHPDHLRRPGGRIVLAAPHTQEDDQPRDRDHIVGDRSPAVGSESAARVENIAEHREDAVEQHLRHADEGESDRQLQSTAAQRGEGPHQQPGAGGTHQRDRGDQDECRGHQTVDEVLAAVGALHRLGDLGNEDGVQDARRQQHQDEVRQGIGGLEGAARDQGAEHRSLQGCIHHAQYPADQGSRRHQQ